MKKNILLIDDDKSLCEELEEILTDEGYIVDKVYDGKKALSVIIDKNYDLILLDLKIPEIGVSGRCCKSDWWRRLRRCANVVISIKIYPRCGQ